jgi:3',5'-cyclic AMP phosphodiesterase CpdA
MSDLHFGPPIRRDRVQAIRESVASLAPDLVVASGDFVQRADFPSQFAAAREFLQSLSAPVLSVPGNHELPLWNPLARLSKPYRNYRQYINPDLEPEHRSGNTLVLAVNSTKPYLIHNGFTTAAQLRNLSQRIAGHEGLQTSVVVTHHPLVSLPDALSARPQAMASRTLRGFSEAGVELVLSGHFHSFRVVRASEHCRRLRREVHVVLSGSSTSKRVHRPHQRGNGFATIEIQPSTCRVTHHFYQEGRGFVPDEEQLLERR